MKEELKETLEKGPVTRRVLPVINTLSLVIGIVAGLMHMREISRHAEDIASFLKISSIGYLDRLTEESESVQSHLSTFLPEIAAREEEVRERIEKGEPGHLIYHSDSLDDYRLICNFWERTAVFVELGYFEFEVVYRLKAFPRRFWSGTGEIRELIGQNWYGKEDPLVDFLSGMKGLEKKYQERDEDLVSSGSSKGD